MKELLINMLPEETTVAFVEEGRLMEIYYERLQDRQLMGNFYKGIVENVLPGMQAAFVDIGLSKNAFLYVEDAFPHSGGDADGEARTPKITELLKTGQEILVQVFKEPVGSKGARVTTNPYLPGRNLVLMPGSNYIAVSRRIEDPLEIQRLKQVVGEVLPDNIGAIIRTAAVGLSAEEMQHEIKSLVKQWKRIQGKSATTPPPALIHRDLDLMRRILRDLDSDSVDRIVVNTDEAKEHVSDLAGDLLPSLRDKIIVRAEKDLFELYNIDDQISQALRRRVWLKSGGYLIIDQVEALTVIDVNTGKYVGESNLAATVFKTNLEAVSEIARQLRLRNVGGIVIVDFIDMDNSNDKEALVSSLIEALKRDRTRVVVLGMTQLGLVEMTRKKIGQELSRSLEKECPFCHGKGRVMTEESATLVIRREIKKVANETEAPAIFVEANPAVTSYLIGPFARNLQSLERLCGKKIIIKGTPGMLMDEKIVRPSYEDEDSHAVAPVKVGQRLFLQIDEPHQDHFYDGIARLDGYIIDVAEAGPHVGKEVLVEITSILNTHAKGRIVEEKGR